MLLGLVAASLGEIPATGALRRLADLLTALDVAESTRATAWSRHGWLTQVLTDRTHCWPTSGQDRPTNALLDAVAVRWRQPDLRCLLLIASSDVEVAILGTMPNWSLRLRTLSPQTVVKGFALDAAVTVDGVAGVQGISGGQPGRVGPVGRRAGVRPRYRCDSPGRWP